MLIWETLQLVSSLRLTCRVSVTTPEVMQVSERSGLEQDLGETVQLVRAKRAAQDSQAESLMYAGNPYNIKLATPGQPLPPPPVSTWGLAVGNATRLSPAQNVAQ